MDEKAENTRVLLIAQMRRAIELLESGNVTKTTIRDEYGYLYANRMLPELSNKLHEIRRDSVRYMREIGYGK